MAHIETILKAEQLGHNRVFDYERRQVLLEDGSTATREIILHRGGVAVAAVDADDCLLMVRQYRTGAGQELLELPAGKLESGEDPRRCGMRELEEECGYRTDSLTLLAEMYPTPAYSSELIRIYRAGPLTPGQMHLDDDEFITPERIPFDKAVELVLSGKITDAKSQIGILQLNALRRAEKENKL